MTPDKARERVNKVIASNVGAVLVNGSWTDANTDKFANAILAVAVEIAEGVIGEDEHPFKSLDEKVDSCICGLEYYYNNELRATQRQALEAYRPGKEKNNDIHD